MWVSFIRNKEINNILNKKPDNDNQNVDGVDQHPKVWQSLLALHQWYFIRYTVLMLFYVRWSCWITRGRICHGNIGFFFTCVFLEILSRLCTSAPYRITMKTRIVEHNYSSNIFIVVLRVSQVYLKWLSG